MYLLKKPPFLDYVSHCFHFNTFGLVNIFESIKLAGLLVLNDPDLNNRSRGVQQEYGISNLSKCTFPNASKKDKVEEIDFAIKIWGLWERIR